MLNFQIFIVLWSDLFDYKNQFLEILDDSSDLDKYQAHLENLQAQGKFTTIKKISLKLMKR